MPKIPIYEKQILPNVGGASPRANAAAMSSGAGGGAALVAQGLSAVADFALKYNDARKQRENAVLDFTTKYNDARNQREFDHRLSLMKDDFAETQNDLYKVPVDQMEDVYKKRSAETMAKHIGKDAPASIRDRLTLAYRELDRNNKVAMRGSQRVRGVALMQQTLDDDLDRSAKAGRMEDGEAMIAAAVESGVLPPEQADVRRRLLTERGVWYAGVEEAQADPVAVAQELSADGGRWSSLSPESQQKLGKYAANLIAERKKGVEDSVIAALASGDYDVEGYTAMLDAAQAGSILSSGEAETWKKKLRDGDIERTSEFNQARLNSIKFLYATKKINAAEAREQVLAEAPNATSKDVADVLGMLDGLQSDQNKEAAATYKAGIERIGELEKQGLFGSRIFSEGTFSGGKDVTEKRQRERLKELLAEAEDARPWWFGTGTEAQKMQKRQAAIETFQKEEEDRLRLLNEMNLAFEIWAKQNPKATPVEAKKYIDSLTPSLESILFDQQMRGF